MRQAPSSDHPRVATFVRERAILTVLRGCLTVATYGAVFLVGYVAAVVLGLSAAKGGLR